MKNNDWKSALGTLLPSDYKPEPAPELPERPAPMPKLAVTLDKKRAGKTATIISGFDPDDPRAAKLATYIKRKLAVGGSSRGGEILIQGDFTEKIKEIIKNLDINKI